MRRLLPRSVVVITCAVFLGSAALGGVVERWYGNMLVHARVASVRTTLFPYGNSVAAAVGRHVSRMAGLAAFVTSRRDGAQLAHEFSLFAAGLMSNVPGIRAIQIVRDGRIAMVHPLEGNRGALGMPLRDSPDAKVRQGYQRAVQATGVTLFGPTPLVQGGEALVIDQRLRTDYDPSLDFVAMLVDMESVLRDLRLDSLPPGLGLEVRTASGKLVGSFGGPLPVRPVRIETELRDGRWTLLGGPSAGWEAAVAPDRVAVRLAIAAIVLLLTALAWQMAGRDARLTREVETRTASLRELVEEHRATIVRQRETEQELLASEERLRLALAASRTATFQVDVATGAIIWSSEAGALFGLTQAETPLKLESLFRYADADVASRVSAAYAEASRQPSQGTMEVRTVGEDGVVRWLQLYWLSSAESDGSVQRVVGTLTDVSERRKLEEQFLHAQKMQAMGALAGGIAHDFNNLLTVILGAGQMARAAADAPGTPDGLRTDLDEVLSAGERASILTGQLLAFSRRQVVQPRHFDACDLVGGMGTMLRRLVGERIRVETALPGTKVPLFADQGQLTQVVMNLAVNARDAMPSGGVLRISLRLDGRPAGPALPNESLAAERFAVLTVADTGSGIDPAIRQLIFDPFFTTKPVGHGTGLGLSTVYGIVMQLGGTVRLTSELGQGTVFEVYLPLSASAEESPLPSVGSAAPTDGAGRTVLLAEDEMGLRHVVERVLRGAGYTLIVAADGAAALAAARSHEGPIELLVTDVVMPGLGGLELAEAMQKERPETKVLLMSGYPQAPGRDGPISLGSLPLVAKPFKPSDLLAACRRALAAE
ncbi:MAG: ATP-binding protein [Gemmatimonadota bacterium]|nr:ATP-binding protein [Gemmatimonadota bacterium]